MYLVANDNKKKKAQIFFSTPPSTTFYLEQKRTSERMKLKVKFLQQIVKVKSRSII